MRLADHFVAAGADNAPFDTAMFAATIAQSLKQAQIFEVADEVAQAAAQLIRSKPSTLFASLPLCRIPYDTMWLEYRGGFGRMDAVPRKWDGAPIPWKQGVLIEVDPPGQSQTGFMTFCWSHNRDGGYSLNISPLAVYFDWRPDGCAGHVAFASHQQLDNYAMREHSLWKKRPRWNQIIVDYMQLIQDKWMHRDDLEVSNRIFTGMRHWGKYDTDPVEVAAVRRLHRHMVPGLSPHGLVMVPKLIDDAQGNEEIIRRFMLAWEADMQGEGGWVQCFLAMLNSRNAVVEHQTVDLTKLNKSRVRSGKRPFLPYCKTRLAMSRSQVRIMRAHGINRETARQHLVRGHFKVRKSGVYWWSPFLRGDATRPLKREQYSVVSPPPPHPGS